jgi:hypothetical protein
MNRRRTPGRPQLRQRCASGEKDSEDEDSFWVREFDDRVRRVFGEASAEDEVLVMPRPVILLTLDDMAREEYPLEVFAREAVMFEFFECVDREAIFAGSDEFPDSFQDAPSHGAILLQPWRGKSTCRARLDRGPENRTPPSSRPNAFYRVSAYSCHASTSLT